MGRETVTLFELNKSLQWEIQQAFPSSYWVIAEISEMKVNSSGHCYLELVEKQEVNNLVISKARATIWAQRYRILSTYFFSTTGHRLVEGMKVLVNVTVEFHEIYGLSLKVLDLDPSFTIGDIKKQRQLTINRLQDEGVFDMNRSLEMPDVPQRIAVISSNTAAGFTDFKDQLENNKNGIKFYYKLFPAVMQGDESEGSIIDALEKVYKYVDFFDIVIVIRGGGARSDLLCFDNYNLANHIAQYPLPVITGIGHEKDESVADLVAFKSLKTPTAVAEYLVYKASVFYDEIVNFQNELLSMTDSIIFENKKQLELLQLKFAREVENQLNLSNEKLNNYISNFQRKVNRFKNMNEKALLKLEYSLVSDIKMFFSSKVNKLNRDFHRLKMDAKQQLSRHNSQIAVYSESVKLVDPRNVLKRGYSITSMEGVVIKDTKGVKSGDIITTRFYKGKLESEVKK